MFREDNLWGYVKMSENKKRRLELYCSIKLKAFLSNSLNYFKFLLNIRIILFNAANGENLFGSCLRRESVCNMLYIFYESNERENSSTEC